MRTAGAIAAAEPVTTVCPSPAWLTMFAAGPVCGTIGALALDNPKLSVALTTWDVPAVVLVVNVAVATPAPFVIAGGGENEPPFVLVHVTRRPSAAPALRLASTS